MKLLARQKKEVRETEELIKDLQFDMLNNDPVTANSTNVAQRPSITSSLLSGFDYGFVSRSEGCRFENVNDFNE